MNARTIIDILEQKFFMAPDMITVDDNDIEAENDRRELWSLIKALSNVATGLDNDFMADRETYRDLLWNEMENAWQRRRHEIVGDIAKEELLGDEE